MTYFAEFYKGDEIVGNRRLRALHREDAAREASALFNHQRTLPNAADKALVHCNLKSETLLVWEINPHGWFHADGYEAVEEHEGGIKAPDNDIEAEDPADRLHREWINANDRND